MKIQCIVILLFFVLSSLQPARKIKTIPIREFGAIPNDCTDDWPAFQKAVYSCLKTGNIAVYIPSGCYHTSKSVHHDFIKYKKPQHEYVIFDTTTNAQITIGNINCNSTHIHDN